ncbi:DnaJ-like protein DjlA [Piscirickettsia salmonis]|uniref:DnaJ domain protein n=1 Tax=Piscirickettsia salmonis TaxID=1238 RepID=A0AAC8VJE2_PISSA|nr:DnaJ domain-containing protein [Piscirickettsia salmonis]AKP74630.1 hypothetical protein PSLF89_3125 [Piscirickettsia salmonis LF-89 = ATCC VR-1361]ALB23633.1 DnaJ domain protein [Piscirickettsia salmonis]AMA43062.1 hypothetical protein AWJ11_12285 [Piscirickettsia salmonis]AOS35531.1 hypothetical protein AVM72_09410 [Piscirickettsia salmonis]APS60235.1 hypothetical protein AVI53_06340 [Piscirickettsia salmonis]
MRVSWLRRGQAAMSLMADCLKTTVLFKLNFKKIRFNVIEESTRQVSALKFLKLLSAGLRAVISVEGKILAVEVVRIEQFFLRVGFSSAQLWQLKQLMFTPQVLPLEQLIHQLRPLLLKQLEWRQLALQALCMSCYVSERGRKHRIARFRYLSERLGYSQAEISAVETAFATSAEHRRRHKRHKSTVKTELGWAYRQLELLPGATMQEIKVAYRRLMSRYHPDKLVARGLGPIEIAESTQKAQRIQQAYRQLLSS